MISQSKLKMRSYHVVSVLLPEMGQGGMALCAAWPKVQMLLLLPLLMLKINVLVKKSLSQFLSDGCVDSTHSLCAIKVNCLR